MRHACPGAETCRCWIAAALAARRVRIERVLARKNTKAPAATGAGKGNE